MTLNIHSILGKLAERRAIFHSEADFQFALAWQIHGEKPDCEVRLEFKPFPEERMYLDIWLPTEHVAIELKYATRKCNVEHYGEYFALKEHSAQDFLRYDYVKDISRLERVVADRKQPIRGYAILVTNDPSYWKSPVSNWQTTMDAQFRLHEGRSLSGELNWREGSNPRTIKSREDSIPLYNSYKLRWQDYSNLGNTRNSSFRYLAVAV